MESIVKNIIKEKNDKYELAAFSVIGDREEQEDCFAFSIKSEEALVVLCDGMGGFQKGQIAGAITTEIVMSEYENHYPCDDISGLMEMAYKAADQKVASITDEKGSKVDSGTTAVSVVIKGRELNWASVGDSRAYIIRNGEYAQLTKDHTYKTVLKEQIKAELIDKEKYYEEIDKGETLINYIGIGNLSLIDFNNTPFPLQEGDIVMLATDGLYKYVDGDEINSIIKHNNDLDVVLEIFEHQVQESALVQNINRDNMTVILLRIL